MKAEYTQQLFKLSCQFRDGLFCFRDRLAWLSLWEFIMKGCGLFYLLYLAIWSVQCYPPLGLWILAIVIASRAGAKVFPHLYLDLYVSFLPNGMVHWETLSNVASVWNTQHSFMVKKWCPITIYVVIKINNGSENYLHELKTWKIRNAFTALHFQLGAGCCLWLMTKWVDAADSCKLRLCLPVLLAWEKFSKMDSTLSTSWTEHRIEAMISWHW